MPSKKNICKHCRAEDIPDHAQFCPWCGHKLVRDKTEIKVPPPQLLPSGTYFNRITVQGERVSISAPTEEEYYAKARATKLGLIKAKKAAPKITLGSAIDKYIREKSNVLSPSTIRGYKSYRKYRFSDYLDKDVGSINYQKMVNDEAREVSPKTLANAWRLVTASLAACRAEIPSVTLPKRSRAERPWLDFTQIQTFLEAVCGKDCELPALLALHGLRRSELLALTADKITGDMITVSGSMVFNANGQLVLKSTNKNETSQRTVHIVIPRLYDLIENAEGRLVTTHPNTIRSQINAICKKAGLPEVGFHGLRHSFASLAYHLKWSEETTKHEGGWSNTQTVHNIYTHLAAQDANSDIQRMKAFYSANEKASKTENA